MNNLAGFMTPAAPFRWGQWSFDDCLGWNTGMPARTWFRLFLTVIPAAEGGVSRSVSPWSFFWKGGWIGSDSLLFGSEGRVLLCCWSSWSWSWFMAFCQSFLLNQGHLFCNEENYSLRSWMTHSHVYSFVASIVEVVVACLEAWRWTLFEFCINMIDYCFSLRLTSSFWSCSLLIGWLPLEK